MTALAAGSDSIAAEEALGRTSWSVIAVLPLELELYAQDFDEAGVERLRRLVADSKLKTIVLPPLTDPRSGLTFSSAALARLPGASNPDRSDHYEQVGLFIAKHSTLLLAVMDAGERPGRVGGTARIVDYRLRGVIDESAARVIARSRELWLPSELDHPPTGPVWMLNLAVAGNSVNPLSAVQLWRPLDRNRSSRATTWLADFATRYVGTRTLPKVHRPLWRRSSGGAKET